MKNNYQHGRRIFFDIATSIIKLLLIAFFVTYFVRDVILFTNISAGTDLLSFNVEGWNSSRYDEEGRFSYTRLKMIDSLLSKYDFHDWSVNQIEDLLGEPDNIERKNGYVRQISYDLGNGLDFLIFDLNNENNVEDYHVYLN